MVAFELYINNKFICRAGIEDLGYTESNISLLRYSENVVEDISITILGCELDTIHVIKEWFSQRLTAEDEVKIKVVDIDAIYINPPNRLIERENLSCKLN
jgi:hypothetical protein